VFLISSFFPLFPLISGLIVREKKVNHEVQELFADKREGLCTKAIKNLKIVWQYLKLPFILKPLIFILLVLVSPGVENAMFYYYTNVLKFDSTQLGLMTVIG